MGLVVVGPVHVLACAHSFPGVVGTLQPKALFLHAPGMVGLRGFGSGGGGASLHPCLHTCVQRWRGH